MNILILEDDFDRMDSFRDNLKDHKVVIVHTAQECIDMLKDHEWDMLFLDHDLGGEQMVDSEEENTGATVAKFLSRNLKYKPPTVIIHSMNPPGAQYMMDLLPGSLRVPGAWNMELE
jgi:DNA-binding response OmpR family regulator